MNVDEWLALDEGVARFGFGLQPSYIAGARDAWPAAQQAKLDEVVDNLAAEILAADAAVARANEYQGTASQLAAQRYAEAMRSAFALATGTAVGGGQFMQLLGAAAFRLRQKRAGVLADRMEGE